MKTQAHALIPKDLEQGLFQGYSMAWVATLTLILLGFLLPARGQDPKLTNINNPMDTNVSVGATVSFRVYASSTNPPMTFQWQHEGTNLPSATNVTLVITNVTVAHAGGYMAWITNASRDFTNTRTATLTVDPTFIKITTGPVVNDLYNSIFGAWGDYDDDGLLDLAVAGGGENPTGAGAQLYHNEGNSEFTRVLTGSLPSDHARLVGGIWADIDNDGDLDWWPSTWPGIPYVHVNDGHGNFTKINTTDLVPGGGRLPGLASAIGDYDQDGFLDVALINYPGTGVSGPDYLLRNQSQGTFETVTNTVWSRIDTTEETVTWVDFNGDGFTDLFSLGDPNRLLQNMGDGTFQGVFGDPLVEKAGAYQLDGSWADFDSDGNFEVLLGRWQGRYELYRYDGSNGFAFSALPPLTDMSPGNGDGSSWGDFDNDGDLDLFVGINIIGTSLTNPNNRLFLNNGDGTFTQVFSGSLVNDGGHSFSSAWADFDNDGFLDLFVANGGLYGAEKNFLYRNNLKNLGNTNHWLKVSLSGVAANRSGVGAKIRVEATIRGKTYWQLRQITATQTENCLLAHFGLADATKVHTLRIEWPSGNVQELVDQAPDRIVTVTEAVRINPVRPTASLNGSVTLTNVSIGTSYQWFHNGTNLAGQTAKTLTLTNLAATDAGRYGVVVTLSDGKVLTNYTYVKVDSTFTKITEGPVVTDKANFFIGTWADYDNDGFSDLLVPAGADVLWQAPAFYHNLGGTNFVKLTTNEVGMVVGRRPYCYQGLWADFNNDGFLDLLEIGTLNDGWSASNRLFYGRSDHTLEWAAGDVGINPNGATSMQNALVDYDNDGAVDIYYTTGWKHFNSRGLLCRNRGDGTFAPAWSPTGPVIDNQYACWGDYDNDGDRDLWLLGGLSPWDKGQFYRNNGDGTFSANLTGSEIPTVSFLYGTWGDYDNDGYLDFLCGKDLFHNNQHGGFTSVARFPEGPGHWADYDNDGDLDFVMGTWNQQPSRFYRNEGGGVFTEVDLGSPSHDIPANETLQTWGDYDNDGFLDLFVATRGNPTGANFLYRNSGVAGGNSNHWLIVKPVGTTSNRSAIGAKVRVLASIRGKVTWQMREISGSYYDDLRAHFGLGNATNALTVRIEWPSGTVQELNNVAADQILQAIEPRRPVLAVVVTPTQVTGTLTGDPNQVYELQVSNELEGGWTVLTIVTTDGSGKGNWSDPGAAPQGRRFYRAVKNP